MCVLASFELSHPSRHLLFGQFSKWFEMRYYDVLIVNSPHFSGTPHAGRVTNFCASGACSAESASCQKMAHNKNSKGFPDDFSPCLAGSFLHQLNSCVHKNNIKTSDRPWESTDLLIVSLQEKVFPCWPCWAKQQPPPQPRQTITHFGCFPPTHSIHGTGIFTCVYHN